MENEIIDSCKEILKRRLLSPLYGVFFISWVIFHWEFIFSLLFLSEEKIWLAKGLLKNDYLRQTYFDFSNPNFYIFWVLPFFATWLVIWKFPKWFSIPAFRKDLEYKIEKQKIEISEKKRLEEEQTKQLKISVQKKEVEKEVIKKEKEIQQLDPKILWKEDYVDFKNSKHFYNFPYVIESIYKHGGSTRWPINGNISTPMELSRDLLAYIHTHGLVELEKGNIVLTEKGKFFIAQYTQENK